MAETNSSETNNVCRTCLGDGEIYNIKQTKYENVKLTEMLNYFAAVVKLEVSDSNNLPQNMCKSCIKSFYKSYTFLRACEKVQSDLEQKLTSEQMDELLHITLKNELITVDGEKYPAVLILQSDEIKTEPDIESDTETTLIDSEGNASHNDIKFLIVHDDYSCPIDNDICLKYENDNGNDITDSEDICEENTAAEASTNDESLTSTTNNELVISNSEYMESKNQIVKFTRSNGRIKGPPFVCITCEESYNDYESLMNHKRESGPSHRRGRSYLCEYCSRRIFSFSSYKQHIRKHTGERPHKCTICDKAYIIRTDLNRHMMVHTGEKPFICHICGKAYRRKVHLKEHQRQHSGKKLYCTFCGKGFSSTSSLYTHEKKHKLREGKEFGISDGGAENAPKGVKCEKCKRFLSSAAKLEYHNLVAHGPKNFKCDECDKAYSAKLTLYHHKRYEHRGLQFPCQQCDKVCKQKSDLAGHMKTHSREEVFRCDKCPKQFIYKTSLRDHQRLHTGDTTYQCPECSQICMNSKSLAIHIQTHTGEKPFSCKICGKPFSQKTNLRAHMQIHTSRKHPCSVCKKEYSTARILRRHIRVHHPEEVKVVDD